MDRENIGGVLSAIIITFILAVIIIGILYFLDIIAWFAIILGIGFLIAITFFFIIVFFVSFVAVFYYLAIKKPSTEPGTYTIDSVKDKRDN